VGVAFKLVQALFAKTGTGFEKWLLDLVAIGTVADCQSLTFENRILVSFGLKVLEKTRWVGLRALMQTAAISGKLDTFTLGFLIAPRINAAGRIKHGNTAFELLVSQDKGRASELAKELNQLNQHRQTLTEQIMSEARAQIQMLTDKKVLLTYGADWPKGIVGLVAGKLAEEYHRPVLAVSTTAEGLAVGSARSVASFNIVAALNHAKQHLEKFGGHTQAAGFTLDSKQLQDFHLKLLEYADFVNFALAEPIMEADVQIEPADINWELMGYLEKFAPFGIGNPRPKFLGLGLQVLEFKTVGNSNKHLKMRVKFGLHEFSAIAFGQAYLSNQLQINQVIDAIFELNTNEWNGNKQLELKILDLKTKDA